MKAKKITFDELKEMKKFEFCRKTWKKQEFITHLDEVRFRWRNFVLSVTSFDGEFETRLTHVQKRSRRDISWIVQEGYGKTINASLADLEAALFQIASVVGYGI